MFFLMSSRPSISLIWVLSASTIGAGALFGRNTPNHDETSNFASSGALSRMVGISGAEALRSCVVTASALSLPSCTCGSDGNRLSDRIWISPDSAACSAGPAPRNRHIPHLHSLQLKHPPQGQMRARADAGRAVGELVGIGLDVGDQLG